MAGMSLIFRYPLRFLFQIPHFGQFGEFVESEIVGGNQLLRWRCERRYCWLKQQCWCKININCLLLSADSAFCAFRRFTTTGRMSCLRACGKSRTRTPSRKATFRSCWCPSWSSPRRALGSSLSSNANANSRPNPISPISPKSTRRTCASWTAAWESSARFATVCLSSTSDKVRAQWCNFSFTFSLLWLFTDSDKKCNKQGLKCIVKNKGESL